jgi:hypothetical protein
MPKGRNISAASSQNRWEAKPERLSIPRPRPGSDESSAGLRSGDLWNGQPISVASTSPGPSCRRRAERKPGACHMRRQQEERGRFNRSLRACLSRPGPSSVFSSRKSHFDIPALEVGFDDLARIQLRVCTDRPAGSRYSRVESYAGTVGCTIRVDRPKER